MPTDSHDDIHAVYDALKGGGAEAFYDDWAAKYDADNAALGFRLPSLAAGFAARYVPRGDGPILDAGAGTGQVGMALRVLGYDDITAIDLSTGMLAVAAKTGAYSATRQQTLGQPLDFADGHFAASLCIGSFGPGHAPPESLHELARVTRPGGHVIFNVVEHAWQDQGFPALIDALTDGGVWAVEEETAPLPPLHHRRARSADPPLRLPEALTRWRCWRFASTRSRAPRRRSAAARAGSSSVPPSPKAA